MRAPASFAGFAMSVYVFLIVVQALIGAALVGVILMQQSEGGGLGVGGSPSGMMSARGVASFMTRATATLATLFVLLSIVLAAIAASTNSNATAAAAEPAPAASSAPATVPSAAPTAATNPLDNSPAKQ
jgi:preprotein translocase subunit SecG